MQSSADGRSPSNEHENLKKRTPQSPPQTDADGEKSKDGETTNDTVGTGARAPRAHGHQHQRRATPEKKGVANDVMSAFGRRDTLTMVRRIEAAKVEAQRAVSTTARVAKALDLVGGHWFRVPTATS